jgi:PAS domain S-box-containing protein
MDCGIGAAAVIPAPSPKGSLFKGWGQPGRMVWSIALGAALILLAAFAVVQQAVNQERALAFANAADINSKIALSDEVRIRSLLASLDKVLLVLRKDFAQNPRLTHQELLGRLEELKIDNELNPRISFIDTSGEVLLSSALDSHGQAIKLNVADRAYFQKQQTEPGDLLDVGMPVEGRISRRWALPLTRRLTRTDGAFGGVITMLVDPSLFTASFEETSMGTNASRAIMGLDGYTRLRLNSGKLIFGGDTRKSQLFQEIKKSKAGTYTAISIADGIRRAVSYRVIDPYGIAILAGSSVEGIEASYSNKVRAYVAAAALFGVLIVLLAGLLILGVLRQRKLIESQYRFNQLIELVPQSIFRMDAQGTIIWANRRTVEYVGPSADEQAKGFGWLAAAVHPDDLGRMKEFIAAALQQRPEADSCEYRKRRLDGVYLWHSSQITRVTEPDGVGDFYLFTSTDIHDRRMAEERARVTQKLESIGQLTGGMAHDFNNLLAIIIGNQDLLKSEALSAAGARRLQVASGAAERGVGLVKSLLAMASKQPLLPATVDLWALVERIAPLLRHALGPRVHYAMQPPDVPVHVDVDEAGLEAVLLNLIVNARDAMPQGGELTLGLEVCADAVRLAITDTGTGMPPAVVKRATEPFFTTKERGHGTGLGLSMVAGFVKQSAGTLKICSAEGQGTTIEIFLPLVRAAAKPLSAVAAPALQRAADGACKILIVDDEPALTELVRGWAKAAGHSAVAAHSADDALALLAVRAFDVLLSDIVMPGPLDGFGLAEQASAMYPAMKILLMSGYSKETATHRADIAWPLLVKPFRKQDFDAALQQARDVSGLVLQA